MAPDDDGTRELDQGHAVAVLLLEADEELAKAIEPGVAGFDDPAPGALAGGPAPPGRLDAAGLDVGHIAIGSDGGPGGGVVVALVRAAVLRGPRPRAGPADRRGPQQGGPGGGG